jgi:hypothetical protein
MALFCDVDKSEVFTLRISMPFGALKRKTARRYIRARAVFARLVFGNHLFAQGIGDAIRGRKSVALCRG